MGLLKAIPLLAEPDGSAAVEARLYPPPVDEPEAEFQEDWHEYVAPGCASFSVCSRNRAARCRRSPRRRPDEDYTLRFPVAHLDAWLNALNQARLALAARHRITERDMEAIPDHGDERALALFQIHVYGVCRSGSSTSSPRNAVAAEKAQNCLRRGLRGSTLPLPFPKSSGGEMADTCV